MSSRLPKRAPIVQFHFVVIWVLLLYCLLSMIRASDHQVLVESFTCMLLGSEIDEVALPHSALAKCPFSPILATRCEARRCFITFLSFCLRISAGILIFNTWRPSNLLDLHILSLRFFFWNPGYFLKKMKKPAPKMDLMRPSSAYQRATNHQQKDSTFAVVGSFN